MENQNENQTVETDTSKASKDEKTFTQAEVDEIVNKNTTSDNVTVKKMLRNKKKLKLLKMKLQS